MFKFIYFLLLFFFSNVAFAAANVDCARVEEKLSIIFGKLEEIEKKIDSILELEKKHRYSAVTAVSQREKQQKHDLNRSFLPPLSKSSFVKESDLENTDGLISYNHALSLVGAGKKDEAVAQFDIFISNFSGSIFVPDAYYWMGDINFEKQDYKKASVNFLKSYKAATQGKKSASSLLKLVACLRNMGKFDEACTIFAKLKTHPMVNSQMKQEIMKEKDLLKSHCA